MVRDDHELSLPDDVCQQITRSQSPHHGDTMAGVLRALFQPGERSRNLHVAFCPPMPGRPTVEVVQLSGPRTRVKAADVQSFGVRFDLRLATVSAARGGRIDSLRGALRRVMLTAMNHPLLEQLVAAGQEHVLGFYQELEPGRARTTGPPAAGLDLDLLTQLTRDKHEAPDWSAVARRSTPPPAIRLDDRDAAFITPAAARRAGEEALRSGRVAAILVAGGQGTRLGFAHPKGMFPIGPVSGHSLFQILIEKVVATSRRYRRVGTALRA